MFHVPLFESQNLKITPVNPEKDSQTIAAWTADLELAAHLREQKPARPMATVEVKKLYESWQKEVAEKNRQFLFAVRTRSGDSDAIIGVVRFTYIEWVHGAAYLDLIIGSPEDWRMYAREALDLALRYAFDELGMFRVSVVVAEHNQRASDLFLEANFTLEVRQERAVYWNQRAWDKLHYGILRPEWKLLQVTEAVR